MKNLTCTNYILSESRCRKNICPSIYHCPGIKDYRVKKRYTNKTTNVFSSEDFRFIFMKLSQKNHASKASHISFIPPIVARKNASSNLQWSLFFPSYKFLWLCVFTYLLSVLLVLYIVYFPPQQLVIRLISDYLFMTSEEMHPK